MRTLACDKCGRSIKDPNKIAPDRAACGCGGTLKPVSETFDAVNRPAHYADRKIEVIDFIEDSGWAEGFCLGNAVKYIARAGKKDPTKTLEDLEKARWYLDRWIKELVKRAIAEAEKQEAPRG